MNMKLSVLRERILSGISSSVTNLSQSHQRAINDGISKVLEKNFLNHHACVTKNIKSPKLVIDIRLIDEIQARKNHTRKVTTVSTHPIKVISDSKENPSPTKEVPVKLYTKKQKNKSGRSSVNKFRKSKNISRYSTTPSNMVSSKQQKYSELTASEEKIRQIHRGKNYRDKSISRTK